MGLSIHTNFASLTTQNQLNNTNKMLGTAMQRLGTGLRINSAADDAAGLQMATRLQAQSNGQKVGMRNAQDAVSMMQTAEGAMDEMTNIVQRMKDLATQGANGTSSAEDRLAIGTEMKELTAELKNISDNTKFGGETLISDAGKFGAGLPTLTWGDLHHPQISLTKGKYDGEWIAASDKAAGRIAVISMRDFKTKSIFKVPNSTSDHHALWSDDSDWLIVSSFFPIPLGQPNGYASLEEYRQKYRGIVSFLRFDRKAGRIVPAESLPRLVITSRRSRDDVDTGAWQPLIPTPFITESQQDVRYERLHHRYYGE